MVNNLSYALFKNMENGAPQRVYGFIFDNMENEPAYALYLKWSLTLYFIIWRMTPSYALYMEMIRALFDNTENEMTSSA